MIYRSNLTAPDLSPHFKHLHSRVMGHSFGHDVPSDWADKADDDPMFGIYKRCGFWTHDEAAILWHVAESLGGDWVDIGCHTGWTTAHIREGVAASEYIRAWGGVWGLDPMIEIDEWEVRATQNTWETPRNEDVEIIFFNQTSDQYFASLNKHAKFDGVCIDGDHEPGAPLRDAQNAAKHLAPTGVIMLHDGVGRPVREAVAWLMANGFRARAYFTPHLVFCCWRGDFTPPDHVPDPLVKAAHLDGRYPDFDFGRMS